jgi:hypothetical protein
MRLGIKRIVLNVFVPLIPFVSKSASPNDNRFTEKVQTTAYFMVNQKDVIKVLSTVNIFLKLSKPTNFALVTVVNLQNEKTTPMIKGTKKARQKQMMPGSAKSAKYFFKDFSILRTPKN